MPSAHTMVLILMGYFVVNYATYLHACINRQARKPQDALWALIDVTLVMLALAYVAGAL